MVQPCRTAFNHDKVDPELASSSSSSAVAIHSLSNPADLLEAKQTTQMVCFVWSLLIVLRKALCSERA